MATGNCYPELFDSMNDSYLKCKTKKENYNGQSDVILVANFVFLMIFILFFYTMYCILNKWDRVNNPLLSMIMIYSCIQYGFVGCIITLVILKTKF